jgi:hypothetical protein
MKNNHYNKAKEEEEEEEEGEKLIHVPIYFSNIQMVLLKHTFQSTETRETCY